MKLYRMATPALAGWLIAHAAVALATTEEKFSRTFTVSPGGTLIVDVDFSAIEVTGSGGNQITVEAVRKVRGRSEAAEKSFLADRPITADQDGNRVTIRARKPAVKGFRWGNGMKQMDGRFVIAVPSKFDVQLDTSG